MLFFVTFVPYQQQQETTQRIFVFATLYTVTPSRASKAKKNLACITLWNIFFRQTELKLKFYQLYH